MSANTKLRSDLADDNRYITDCGPRCPGCAAKGYNSIDGQTMWVFWVHPGQSSGAQCATCHHFAQFFAPGNIPSWDEAVKGHVTVWPDIHEVKAAFVSTRKDL